MAFTTTEQLHLTIKSNLKSMTDDDIKFTRWHVRLNAEDIGRQYIKRFGEPIPQSQPLMVGKIIQRYLIERFKEAI